jgi:CDP-glycerol glycerophosphotransferase (TagB/SpsB family)|tara:strand:+ start:1695 stop:2882 length:1188 start_codon:yes stop_codon:yes gene_type:complete
MKKYKMIQIVIKPFLFLIYYTLYFVPRTNKIWLFGSGSGHSFSDNAKYLFLYSYSRKDVKYYWISKNNKLVKKLIDDGYDACYAYSLKGVWLSIISKVYIYDGRANGINFWTSLGSYHINLWHGSPLKKLDRDIHLSNSDFFKGFNGNFIKRNRIRYKMPEWFVVPDLMIATSDKVACYLKSAFGTSNVISLGYPRNDIILNNNLDTEHNIDNYDKVVLYAPTFRDTNTENRELLLDCKRLNDLLIKNKTIFLVKLHRHDKSIVMKDEFSNINLLDNDIDVYPMFKNIDLLITDYSSIFFDFLLTEKPILFYPYDKDSYLSNDRPMYDDYDSVTPGYKVLEFSELYLKLELFFNNPRSLKEGGVDYNKTKDLYHKYKDAKGSERTYNYIRDKFNL